MAQGLYGVPQGPLSAYLGTEELNRKAGVDELQGALAIKGMLARAQAQQREAQFDPLKKQFMEAQIADLAAKPEDRKLQLAATREMSALRLQQAANQLQMQNQFNQSRIDSMKDENARKVAHDAWQKEFQTQQLAISKQLADLKEASTVRGRPIPSPLQKQLTESSEIADATQRFNSTFKDTYAGDPLTGELRNTVGRYFGDDTGRSQWWQDYELHQSQVRNKLFGSALTQPEIEAWNKSAINPKMEVKQVKENLKRRNDIEQKGIDRLIKGTIAGGYSKEQVEALTGRGGGGGENDPLGIRK